MLNFKISSANNTEFFISPKRKFPSVPALLEAYHTSPIRSKKSGPSKILLLYPIPVDPALEQKHKQLLEDKGQESGVRGQGVGVELQQLALFLHSSAR